jgi:DNA polymerase-3 subunit alpha
MGNFVHLHNHTHYSLLDAMTTPKELVTAAVEDGHPAVALTDHGVMFGTVEFYNEAKAAGIKPIIGMEGYIANGSRHERTAMQRENRKTNYYHILLHAKNDKGYRNLLKLTSLAHTEGYYYKPRFDKELLEKYHEGIICTSACMGSMVNDYLLKGEIETAYEEAAYYKDLFGEDFYVEVQNHFLDKDKIILEHAPKIAKYVGAKMIATNDIHYLKKDNATAHNVLLHIRDANPSKGNQPDISDLRYGTEEYYFKTEAQMRDLFREFPGACDNTMEIAEKCNFELDTTLQMPTFPIPDESPSENLEEYLSELVFKGLGRKFPEITEEIRSRANHELQIINKMGFPGYFLIVWDFIRAAHERGITVGPGRGSAAGSLVAYALDITNVDPLKFDLLFERFLNPERVSMPDIDIDFNDEQRDDIIDYVKQRYGEEAVAQIITFGKLSSKAVITDVGRVLGIELSKVKEITKAIPVFRGKVYSIDKALEIPELKWLKETNDKELVDLIKYSRQLEGKFRHTGIHAAGVVIAPGEISNYVPVYQDSRAKEQSVQIATQYSMNELEQAGLLKMDFLGLRTLSIIDNTLEMIKNNHGVEIDINKIDLNDRATFDLFGNGDTLGIFQFESGGMQEYLKKLKPQNIEEITAMNALYRPGPMDNIPEFIERRHGRSEIKYLHPIMEGVLKKTYGIIVYQEQVMQLVQVIADFSLGQADVLRRAMGKKKFHIMDQMKPTFIEGAAKHGISDKLANEIFDLIYKFADYGFNKSHSVAYSYVAYQTAWLKTHYPAEFLAANMTAEIEDQDKIVALIDEAKKFGVELQPPDINRSKSKFNVEGKNIFFGMAATKNVGRNIVDKIVEARESEGNFTSIFDFVARVDPKVLNKRALEALVASGAFDSLHGGARASLFDGLEMIIEFGKRMHDGDNSNMDSLFGGEPESDIKEPDLPEIPEWSEKKRLDMEKEYLNFYVSGHPLNRYKPHIKTFSSISLGAEDIEEQNNTDVSVCGIITDIRTRRDKKDNTIAFIQFEDLTGKAELIFWSDAYAQAREKLAQDAVIVCYGRLKYDDNVKIVVNNVLTIEEAIFSRTAGFKINVDISSDFAKKFEMLKEKVFNGSDQITDIQFDLIENRRIFKRYKSFGLPLELSDKTIAKIAEIFGSENVRFLPKS